MNLRVDLILETEQRSASVVSLKFVVRLVSILVPAIVGLLVAVAVINVVGLKGKVSQLEAQWRSLEPKKKKAEEVQLELANNRHLLKALESWPSTKITVHDQLESLMEIVPAEIQIITFSYGQKIELVNGRDTTRITSLNMDGKAIGASSERNLQLFADRLKQEEPFKSLLANVQMKGRGDPSPQADKWDRLYRIGCVYHARRFIR